MPVLPGQRALARSFGVGFPRKCRVRLACLLHASTTARGTQRLTPGAILVDPCRKSAATLRAPARGRTEAMNGLLSPRQCLHWRGSYLRWKHLDMAVGFSGGRLAWDPMGTYGAR